jgi:hypothetical protein
MNHTLGIIEQVFVDFGITFNREAFAQLYAENIRNGNRSEGAHRARPATGQKPPQASGYAFADLRSQERLVSDWPSHITQRPDGGWTYFGRVGAYLFETFGSRRYSGTQRGAA